MVMIMDLIIITNNKKKARQLYPDAHLITDRLARIIDRVYPDADIVSYWDDNIRPMSPELELFLAVYQRLKQAYEE